MKISQSIHVEDLASLLIGKTTLDGVTPWRSQIRALSRAITFVESDPLLANYLLSNAHLNLLNKKSASRVVGITGLPGAGKSSLTNLFVKLLRAQGKTVAVLAVDPSSTLSGGAILGDRVRMQDHFHDEQVYIRSMGARGSLGGISRATRSSIRLCGLLGFDYILVETVGIGQNESAIVDLADTTVLVLMPHSGDEIQLMKAGVLQLANIYVINKSDLADSSRMVQELKENVCSDVENKWMPVILKSSAMKEEGVREIVAQFEAHAQYEKVHPVGQQLKRERAQKEVLQNMLLLCEEGLKEKLGQVSSEDWESVMSGATTAMAMAKKILNYKV